MGMLGQLGDSYRIVLKPWNQRDGIFVLLAVQKAPSVFCAVRWSLTDDLCRLGSWFATSPEVREVFKSGRFEKFTGFSEIVLLVSFHFVGRCEAAFLGGRTSANSPGRPGAATDKPAVVPIVELKVERRRIPLAGQEPRRTSPQWFRSLSLR